jgi:hypothetical protein
MDSNKLVVRLSLSLAAVAILVPLVSEVNHFADLSIGQSSSRSLRSDGTPIPPLPPPKKSLMADGTPIPPLPPPKGTFATTKVLTADGTPIPPLPPPKDGDSKSASSHV